MPMVGQLWVTGAYGGANELHVPIMFFLFCFFIRFDFKVAPQKSEKVAKKVCLNF